jgi:hypothetical protein
MIGERLQRSTLECKVKVKMKIVMEINNKLQTKTMKHNP